MATSGADSVATGPDVAAFDPQEIIEFPNDDIFAKVPPFDVTDKKTLGKLFPGSDGDCDNYIYVDGTPWYSLCAYTGVLSTISYYDFFDNEPQRFYFFELTTGDPDIEFALGIHVGMSRREFLDALQLKDPKAETRNNLWAHQVNGRHKAMFAFQDDKLYRATISFDYGGTIPVTMERVPDTWTEVYMSEGEDEVETHVPCGPRSYNLQGMYVGAEQLMKYVLTVGTAQDARVDTVAWIKRTGDGFLISAYDSQASGKLYTRTVTFRNEDWTLADWEGTLYASPTYPEPLVTDRCEGEQP